MDPRRFIVFVSILIGAAPLLDAAALGLGEATLDSRLNEPLAVEVVLIGIDLETDKPVAAIASEDIHAAAGIRSVELLRRLRVDISATTRHQAHVRISTDQSIREPVVSFLLMVENGHERVMREYTLLLDPPGYFLPAVASPEPRLEPVRAPAPDVPVDPPSAPQIARALRQIGPVSRGDTLSELAMRLRKEPGVTWAQMAWALYRLNPQAFIGGDINLLRSDVYLRVPTADTASRWSHREALALIKAGPRPTSIAGVSTPRPRISSQASPIVASPTVEQPAASSSSPTDELPAMAPETVMTSESELPPPVFRLLSPDAFDSTPSDGSIVAPLSTTEQEHIHQLVAQANQQIRDSHEEIARAREQLTDTAHQISALVETVGKKDLEIKGLESRLADLREFVKQQSTVVREQEPTWLQRLLLEVLLLGAMVVVLAVTLTRWTDARRRRGGNVDEARIALELPVPTGKPIQSLPVPVETEIETQMAEEEHPVESSAEHEVLIEYTELEELDLDGDPLMEVNAYFAYGYHEKAKEVLEVFIKENPAHAESRLLMLRVLHSIREKRKFRRHAEALLELVDDQSDQRWTEAARLGRALLPEERLFNANSHKRAEDERWEETIWTGARPDITESDDHLYLDIDEFKYVDLFLLDKAEDEADAEDEDPLPDPSVDAAADPEATEADLAEWRAKLLKGVGDRGFSFEPGGPGDEPADDEQS